MSDIVRLYDEDIGSSNEALENQLMSERKDPSSGFQNLPRKHQLKDLTLNQLWLLHRYLMRDWMHFQTRCIVPLPRTVKVANSLVHSSNAAVAEVKTKIHQGKSLKHRVSRSLLKKFKAKQLREDPLLWNWSIHHFHLGDFDPKLGYAKGTDQILFAYIDHELAVLIGIGTHKDFSKNWLIERLFETAPELLDRFNLNHLQGPSVSGQWNDQEKRKVWKTFTVLPTYCGQLIYPPGDGVVRSGHALRIVDNQSQILHAVSKFDKTNLMVLNEFAPVNISFDGSRLLLRHNDTILWKGKPLV